MKTKSKSLLYFIGVIILAGCWTTKEVTTETETEQLQPKLQPKQIQAENNFKIWRQSEFRQIQVGDIVSFYNNTEIVLRGTAYIEVIKLIDGKARKVKIPKYITKIIPARTPGKLISLERRNGIIGEMTISFSIKDETYICSFVIANDDSFILFGNAPLIYEGNEYITTAETTKICQLLWDYSEHEEPEYINGQAEGVSVHGEQTITIER